MKIIRFLKKVNYLDVIVVLFGLLFVYAAVSKLLEYEEFKTQVGKSPLIMTHVKWIPWAIPSIEIIIAIMLFIPRLQLLALFGSFALMAMFTGYIIMILNFSPHVPCSCGGILSSMGWTEHMIFNIVFALLAVVGIVLHNRQKRHSPTDMVSPTT